MIQACLNGARRVDEHPALPISVQAIVADAVACTSAGAGSLHIHARAGDGAETLDPEPVAALVEALRERLPRAELSLSTGLWISGGDVRSRERALEGWTRRPDLVSVNVGEPGWSELIALASERGIGVEAGLAEVADAEALVASGLVESWGRGARGSGRRHSPIRRILIEPAGEDQVALAVAIGGPLDRAAIPLNRLYHGTGAQTWDVLAAAGAHDVRVGLEDVLTLPDGSPAGGNAELVAAAVSSR